MSDYLIVVVNRACISHEKFALIEQGPKTGLKASNFANIQAKSFLTANPIFCRV